MRTLRLAGKSAVEGSEKERKELAEAFSNGLIPKLF